MALALQVRDEVCGLQEVRMLGVTMEWVLDDQRPNKGSGRYSDLADTKSDTLGLIW